MGSANGSFRVSTCSSLIFFRGNKQQVHAPQQPFLLRLCSLISGILLTGYLPISNSKTFRFRLKQSRGRTADKNKCSVEVL